MHRTRPHPFWPLFDLAIHTPTLTLRYVDDELLTELAALAVAGIHDPDVMPFSAPWSRAESPQLEREMFRYHWRQRELTTPEAWHIVLAAIVDGVTVGMSALLARDFARTREFSTGSWLGREFQGRGIGRQMRAATLHLGFCGFGAQWATTSAWHDNAASLGVTRSLGYTESGRRRIVRDDSAADVLVEFEMPRSHYDARVRRDDIELIGVEAVNDLLEIG